MSITDKPNSLRWMLFINIVSIFICVLLIIIITSFFENELKIVSGIITLCSFMVVFVYVIDIYGDKIFIDPKYRISKKEMDNFLKQKIDFTKIRGIK